MIDPGYEADQRRAVAVVSEGHCPRCLIPLVEGRGPYGWCLHCDHGYSAQRNHPDNPRYQLTGDVEYTIYDPFGDQGPAPHPAAARYAASDNPTQEAPHARHTPAHLPMARRRPRPKPRPLVR